MSILQKLSPRKTKYYFMKSIMKDESTTSNNIYIINDLFHRQIEFESDDSQFNDDLRLMKEDLKTVQRILSVKLLRSEIFTLSYDKFD